jgi:hypothetical protein
MDNPEKLATKGTQDEEKQNTICVGQSGFISGFRYVFYCFGYYL